MKGLRSSTQPGSGAAPSACALHARPRRGHRGVVKRCSAAACRGLGVWEAGTPQREGDGCWRAPELGWPLPQGTGLEGGSVPRRAAPARRVPRLRADTRARNSFFRSLAQAAETQQLPSRQIAV